MSGNNLNIAFFGSSLVSAYWNGAATYYRGIIKALNEKGHKITFYEPDIYERQQHRDIPDPDWAKVKVYNPNESDVYKMLADAEKADIIIKASGVGIYDDLLESAVLEMKKHDKLIIFWDVDAPATLDRVKNNPDDYFHELIHQYDFILTYGGGEPVVRAYKEAGAIECYPIYNALDPDTHYPVEVKSDFICDLAFLGNRLPDREERVERFFLSAADSLPDKSFIIGGNGWQWKQLPANVKHIGHVFTKDHNAFNCSPKAVLNISRESMARYGFSPATRVFEAAGAAGCIITDYWEGIDTFFEPGKEILVVHTPDDVINFVKTLTITEAKEIGTAAYKRVLAEHTYNHRAELLEKLLKFKVKKVIGV